MYLLILRRGPLLARLGTLAVMVTVVVAGRLLQGPPARPAFGPLAPVTRVEGVRSRVALTFDVTWGEKELSQILAILAAEKVQATFFVSHLWAATHPELLRQMAAQGHEIGTLGVKMVSPDGLKPGELAADLAAAQSQLDRVLAQPARLYRPYAGGWNTQVQVAAQQQRLRLVLWSLDAGDSLVPAPRPEEITRRVVRAVRPGEVIRLHASDHATSTAAALPGILKGLRERGLEPGPVTRLVPES
ncbi:MAG: polysaccharide deacetylase family protein [Firmicutes bacterium]|nr:polysaccharide deacetylase family protein [Bacillota bacterium]